MLAGILAALSIIKDIIDGVKAVSSFIQENKREAWFQESAKVFSTLREAKTTDERKKIAQDLAALWRGVK